MKVLQQRFAIASIWTKESRLGRGTQELLAQAPFVLRESRARVSSGIQLSLTNIGAWIKLYRL